MSRPTRTYRNAIPEQTSKRIGRRLEMLRKIRGFHRTEVACMSVSTLTNYEIHDVSTMKLGDVYHYADQLRLSPAELMRYITDSFEEDVPIPEPDVHEVRMGHLMEALPPQHRTLAIDIVAALVDNLTSQDEDAPLTSAQLAKRKSAQLFAAKPHRKQWVGDAGED